MAKDAVTSTVLKHVLHSIPALNPAGQHRPSTIAMPATPTGTPLGHQKLAESAANMLIALLLVSLICLMHT